ncbi:hypothetical protein [Calycomorphotria hydatis]|nr:hypothetical protein [Calycomorphotria hydatis]
MSAFRTPLFGRLLLITGLILFAGGAVTLRMAQHFQATSRLESHGLVRYRPCMDDMRSSVGQLKFMKGWMHLWPHEPLAFEASQNIDQQTIAALDGLSIESLLLEAESQLTPEKLDAVCRMQSLKDLSIIVPNTELLNRDVLKKLAQLPNLKDLYIGCDDRQESPAYNFADVEILKESNSLVAVWLTSVVDTHDLSPIELREKVEQLNSHSTIEFDISR